MEDYLNKKIISADNTLSIIILINMAFLYVFFTRIAIMCLIIYPSVALIFHGFLKTYQGIYKKSLELSKRILKITFGIIGIIFAIILIAFIILQPNVSFGNVIQIIAFPIMIMGSAGVLKGMVIDLYSINYRILNIIIGVITLIITGIAFAHAEVNPLFHFFTLSIMFFLNLIFRSGLYLSEFGLSIKKLRNFKIVLFIINNYDLENEDFARLLLKELQQE